MRLVLIITFTVPTFFWGGVLISRFYLYFFSLSPFCLYLAFVSFYLPILFWSYVSLFLCFVFIFLCVSPFSSYSFLTPIFSFFLAYDNLATLNSTLHSPFPDTACTSSTAMAERRQLETEYRGEPQTHRGHLIHPLRLWTGTYLTRCTRPRVPPLCPPPAKPMYRKIWMGSETHSSLILYAAICCPSLPPP